MVWLYPSFLWALTALLIPIVIHLFNFRRYKKIIFSDIRFLKQVNQQTKSGNQLKKYLILASRLLAFTFLVFAFAQPLLLHKDQSLNNGKKYMSLIIDNSYSMNLSGSEGQLLEAAKNRARAIVNSASNNDRFNIITSDMQAPLLHFAGKQATLENIDKIRIGPGAKKLSDLQELQNRLLKDAEGDKLAFTISDFQKKNASIIKNNIDTGIRQTWIMLPGAGHDNLSIDTCYLQSPILQVKQNISLVVQVSNYTPNDIEGNTLELLVDGKPKGIATYSIRPYGSEKQLINFTLEQGGSHACELRLTGDNIPVDDQLYFSLNIHDNFRVTNISDDQERYVEAVFSENPGYTYKKEFSGSVNFSNFRNNSLIILQGAGNINSGFSTEIRKFISNGGTAFVFPAKGMPYGGLQTLASSFGFNLSEQPLNAAVKVSSLDLEHPVFRHIFEKTPKNPDLPAVSAYYQLQVPGGISLMRLANGQSFLHDFPVGKGHLLICASPLSPEFTNFQNHALFVPVLLKSAMLSDYRQQLYFDCGSSQPIYTGLPFEAESGLYLAKDKNTYIPEVINTDGEMFINTNGEIEIPGHYQLKNRRSDSTLASLAFNINRDESDTRTYTEDEFTAMAASFNSLWKWCIIFVLIFLLIEILLIRFFRTHAKLPA
jgi:uncharacterized membrane protein YobD (UPF0266 family)